MKTIKNLLLVLGFGLLSASASAQNPETGALMTDPNVGCAYGYGQYGYMNCGGSAGSSGSARPQPPKVVNRYGAIAWNNKTGAFDSAVNQDSKKKAVSVALNKCGKDCTIVSTYANQCTSVVWGQKNSGSTGKLFYGNSLNQSTAESQALQNCSKAARNCQVFISECSKYN
jgi:hypothetical protein